MKPIMDCEVVVDLLNRIQVVKHPWKMLKFQQMKMKRKWIEHTSSASPMSSFRLKVTPLEREAFSDHSIVILHQSILFSA